jgi:phosphate acyltransferase
MAWRHKPDSSLTVGLKLLKEGKGDAFLSAGSTGALLSGATLMVKRVPGVRRAAVAPTIPTGQGHAVLIDAGANAECTPEQMVQFAIMGSYYAELSLGIENPRVGLLNIGSEPSKGTELYQQVHKLLSQLGQEGKLNFVGNIEGREAVAGEADVLVADGFTGNIFLKTIEGTASWFNQEIKNILLRTTLTKLAALTLKDGIAAFKRKCDYREIGGTALLGIAKPVIKAHGSSDAFAFRSAVKQAIAYAQGNVTEKIAAQLAEPAAQEKEKEVK